MNQNTNRTPGVPPSESTKELLQQCQQSLNDCLRDIAVNADARRIEQHMEEAFSFLRDATFEHALSIDRHRRERGLRIPSHGNPF